MLHIRPQPWALYHTFDFPNGYVLQGSEDTPYLSRIIQTLLPDVRDKTVLDIGAWDGYHSFTMHRLGAKRVLATDHFCWSGPGWGNKNPFDTMRIVLDAPVEDMEIDPAHIRPETVGMFDIVLFMGVLYHRPDCYQAFLNAVSVCNEWLVLETMLDSSLPSERPLWAFHAFDDLGNDPTNWFVPNVAAVEAMFASVGMLPPIHLIHESPLPNHPRGLFVSKKIHQDRSGL